MKKIVLIVMLTSCKLINPRDAAEKHMGPGTVCSDDHHQTVRCIRGGVLFICTVHGERVACAQGDTPLPEGK